MYTDKNGYVIGIDESESVKIEDVYYVTGIGKDGGVYSDSYLAQAVSLADDSVTEFKLKDDSDHKTTQALYGNNDSLKTNADKTIQGTVKIDTTVAACTPLTRMAASTSLRSTTVMAVTTSSPRTTRLLPITDKLNKDENKMIPGRR